MDFVGIALGLSAVAVVVVVAVVGLFVVRSINRSAKSGNNSDFMDPVKHIGSFIGHTGVQGDTRGGLLDQLDSVGQKLVTAGIVQQTTWESSFAPVAAELIKHKPKPPTAVEAPAA